MSVLFSIIKLFISGAFGKIFGNPATKPINAIKQVIDDLDISSMEKEKHKSQLDEIHAKNSAQMTARSAILWICAIVLAIVWIPQYSLASFFWVRDSLAHGAVVAYQLDTTKLFEMIASLLGFGTALFLHKFFK